MYTGFNVHLGFEDKGFPKGELVSISDFNIDGNFVLHHFITSFIKNGGKVCLFGFVQTLSHYTNACQKLGVQLKSATEKGQFVFVDVLKSFLLRFVDEENTAKDQIVLPEFSSKALWELINRTADGCDLIVVDDITSLVNIGLPTRSIGDLIHYCRVRSYEKDCSFVILAHKNPDDIGYCCVQAYLDQYATVCIHVAAMETGYCRDLSGKLFIQRPSCNAKDTHLHFKLHDRDVRFFAPGTSTAVL